MTMTVPKAEKCSRTAFACLIVAAGCIKQGEYLDVVDLSVPLQMRDSIIATGCCMPASQTCHAADTDSDLALAHSCHAFAMMSVAFDMSDIVS